MGANKLEVVLTPALLPLYEVKGKTVVVIDILRATTSICVAFQTGVRRILPVATPEEALLFRDFDFLVAAERNAVKVEGFDMGNSPFEFENPLIQDKQIAFTTTNGTKAIKLAKDMGAGHILIGSFLNLDAIKAEIIRLNKPAVLLCAGWKDKFNIEDTLFAGAVAQGLQATHEFDCDAAVAAISLYELAKNDIHRYVNQASHAKRFRLLNGNTDDISYCLQMNTITSVPRLDGEYISVGASQIHG